MKPHNHAKLSFGKMLLVVGAIIAGIGMSGAFGDGKSPPPDFSKFGKAFDVKDRGDKPSPRRTKKPRPADEPPSMTCDGDQCWWTEMGRPK